MNQQDWQHKDPLKGPRCIAVALGFGVLTLIILLVLVKTAHCEMPDAPSERMMVHTPVAPAPAYRIVDRPFVTVYALYWGSAVFDFYTTSRGTGNPACLYWEGNSDLGKHPSNGRIAGYAMGEAAAVTVGGIALKALGRHLGMSRRMATLVSSGPALWGTRWHVKGGMSWVRTGCL